MKKPILFLIVLLSSFQLMAQSEDQYLGMVRDIIQTEKKAVIAEEVELTDAESAPFWALYDEYESKSYLIHDKRIAIIKEFAANFENLTDEKADEIYTDVLNFQKELLKLKMTYYKKFKKIVPAGKAALLMQIENKIEALIDAELALEIPLLDTK